MLNMESSVFITVVPTFYSEECVGAAFYAKLAHYIQSEKFKFKTDDYTVNREEPAPDKIIFPALRKKFSKILEACKFIKIIKPSLLLCFCLSRYFTLKNFSIIKSMFDTCDRLANNAIKYVIFPYQNLYDKCLLAIYVFYLAKRFNIKSLIFFLEPCEVTPSILSREYFAIRVLEKVSYNGLCQFAAVSYDVAKSYVGYIAAHISIFSLTLSNEKEDNIYNTLIFYTVKNFSDSFSGSSLRVHLLGTFLQSKNYHVTYLLSQQKVGSSKDISFYPDESNIIDRFIYFVRRNYDKIPFSMEMIQIYLHFIAGHTRKFRLECAKAFLGKDIIFLEHAHYARNILRIIRSSNLRVFLTLYDDDANRCKLHFVARLIRKNYEKILPLCSFIATVAQSEHEMLLQHGIPNYLIPSTSDLLFINSQIRTAVQTSRYTPRKRILFVGSRYYPNINAKNRIKKWAAEYGEKNDWEFIIVGGCTDEKESFNCFSALGTVPEERLIYEYANADVIIAPLTEGTGASVKTIEGMATAKPVLGTEVAFRGLSVKNGINCYIENSLDDFPTRLAEIFADSASATRVGVAGSHFALEYDYRKIFTPYSEVFM